MALDISRKRSLPEYAYTVANLCTTHKCKYKDANQKIRQIVIKNGMSSYDQLWGDHEHLTPKGCELIAQVFSEIIQ